MGAKLEPNNMPSPFAMPAGKKTIINPNDSKNNKRALELENEAALRLQRRGFQVEQNPTFPGNKNPDYKINGIFYDCYSPMAGTGIESIVQTIEGKVSSGQTHRVVLNLFYWLPIAGEVKLKELKLHLHMYSIQGLEHVLALDRHKKYFDIYPLDEEEIGRIKREMYAISQSREKNHKQKRFSK